MFDYNRKIDFDHGKIVQIDQKEFIQYLEKAIKKDGDYSPQQLTDLCFNVRYVLLQRIGQCKKGSGDYLINVDREIVQSVIGTFIKNY